MTCSPPPRSWADLPWRRCWPGCRRAAYTAGLEPAGRAVEEAAAATGKSAVSRRFGGATEAPLGALMTPRPHGLGLGAPVIHGGPLREHTPRRGRGPAH